MEIKVKIIDPIGLHARPAAEIAKEAAKFKSDIKIIYSGKEANLKSIMSVMALAVRSNSEITIKADGADADQALKSIKKAMSDKKLI